ncbi:MAG: hypothetical protein ACSHWN_04835 [Methylophilaceae bacterium]
MHKLILLIILAMLSGCSFMQEIPDPPKVIEVKVEVPVQCLGPLPEKPDFITDAVFIMLLPGAFVTELHIDRLKRDMYMAQLEAAIEGCKQIH